MDDRPDVQFLGGEQRKTLGEIKPHLSAEQAARPGACAVRARFARLKNFLQKVQIHFHRAQSTKMNSAPHPPVKMEDASIGGSAMLVKDVMSENPICCLPET